MNKCKQSTPEEILKKVESYILNNKQFFVANKLERIYESLVELIKTIVDDISKMKEDIPIGLSKGRIEKSTRIYSYIENYLYNNKLSEDILKFLTDFNFIVKSWYLNLQKNEETQEDDTIASYINKVDLLITNNLTMREALFLLREQIQTLKNIRNFEPPAFKISQHLLDILEKEG